MSDAPLFEIRTDAALGRHAVAMAAIKSGTRLLSETPILLAPDDASLLAPKPLSSTCARCAMCLRRNVVTKGENDEFSFSLVECSKCALRLCRTDCLATHDAHECLYVKLCLAVYVKLKQRVPLMTLLAMMRAARWRRFQPTELARFDELFAPLDLLRQSQSERVAIHEEAANHLCTLLKPDVTVQQLMLAYARFNLNSFSFNMGDNPLPLPSATPDADIDDTDAVLLFWRASFFNHSCWPNARLTIDRDTVTAVVEAIADIAPGESIHISYAESILPRFERKVFLMQTKMFLCRCERCADSTEGNTFLRASQCGSCHNGWLCPSDDLSQWTCSACGFVFNDTDKVLSLAEVVIAERGRNVRQLVVSGDTVGALRDCGALIDELTVSRLHPGHSIRLRIGILFVHAAMAAADNGTLSADDCASAVQLCGAICERLGALRVVAMRTKMEASLRRLQMYQQKETKNAPAATTAATSST